MRKKINEEEDIGIRKCREKSPIDKNNREVRGWTSSSKNPERLTDTKKTKEENSLEKSKRKKERVALEWDDLDMQAELKSFMYIDRSLRANKDKLIDELNFKIYAIKEITEKKVLRWDYKQTKKIYHSS